MNGSAMKRAAPVPPAVPVRALPPVALSDGVGDMADHTDSGSTGSSSRKSSSIDGTVTLSVILPDGQTKPFNVNRRMPLMDLLVHAAAVHHFNPTDYAVYNPKARFHSSALASTPVGELGTDVVQIVPKNSAVLGTMKRTAASVKADAVRSATEQPLTFEKTFRLQINLPHQQKMMLRVSPKQPLHEILGEICAERSLDARLYTLRNPKYPDRPLDLYRVLGDEQTKEISLVPSGQGTIAQDIHKPEPFSPVHVEPPRSPVQEKSGLNIFRICRKKRMTHKDYPPVTQSTYRSEHPLRSVNPTLSKSMVSLANMMPPATNDVYAVPVKPVRNGKKPAPQPPPTGPATDSKQPSYAAMEKAQRTRHHSESSGYDESLVLGASPDRDGETAGRPSSTVTQTGHLVGSGGRVPVSARSSTSTPDSGLKSASEGVLKTVHVSKKKAPAPPPPVPLTGPLATDTTSLRSVKAEDIKIEVRSRAPSSISATSTSDRISLGSSDGPHSNPSTSSSVSIKQSRQTSSDTLHAVPLSTTRSGHDTIEQRPFGTPAHFTFENDSQHSSEPVAEQDFDSESSADSLDIPIRSKHGSISVDVDVEVHKQPTGDAQTAPPDWGYRHTQEPISLMRSFPLSSTDTEDDRCNNAVLNTTILRIGGDGDMRPGSRNSPLPVEEDRFIKQEIRQSNTGTPPAFKNLYTAAAPTAHPRTTILPRESNAPEYAEERLRVQTGDALEKKSSPTISSLKSLGSTEVRGSLGSEDAEGFRSPSYDERGQSGVSTPDSGIHSQRTSIKESSKSPDGKQGKKPVVSPLEVIALESGASQLSPSPSTTSLSSLKAPALPVSTPPPVTTPKPTLQPLGRRVSPAHVSISSLADAKPDRYKGLIVEQPVNDDPDLPTPILPTDPNSKEELLKEIKLVQDAINSLQNETQLIQSHPQLIAEDLVAIGEKQRILQEHIQRQIVLTDKLLQSQADRPKITTAAELRSYLMNPTPPEPPRKNSVVAAPPVKTPVKPSENPAKIDVIRTTRPKIQHRDSWLSEGSRHFDFSKPPDRAASPANSQTSFRRVDHPKADIRSAANWKSEITPKTDIPSPKVEIRPIEPAKVEPRPVESPKVEIQPAKADFRPPVRRVTPEPRVVVKWVEKPKVDVRPLDSEPKPEVRPAVDPKSVRPLDSDPKPEMRPANEPKAVSRTDSGRRVQISPVRGEALRTFTSPTRIPDDIDIPRNVAVARQITGNSLQRTPSKTEVPKSNPFPVTNYSSSRMESSKNVPNGPVHLKNDIPKSNPVAGSNFSGNGPESSNNGWNGPVPSGIRRASPMRHNSDVKSPITTPPTKTSVKSPDSAVEKPKNNFTVKSGESRPAMSVIVRSSDPINGKAENTLQKSAEDPRESVVRSWKNGTPTPYHQVNQGKNGRPEEQRRMMSTPPADLPGPPPPPPPPPPTTEVLRSASVKREVKSPSPKEPSGPDARAELCDAIKSFSVGSLRKVPPAVHKTWAPKVR